MPKVNVTHKSKSTPTDAYQKIREFLEGPEGLKKFDSKANFQFDSAKMTGQAKGGQFSANFTVSPEGSGSKIEMTVELPLLMTPLKGKIQETIAHQLAKFVA